MVPAKRSYLDIVERRFLALASPPASLTVDGAALGNGLPAREIGLDELRGLLIGRQASWQTIQAVWQELVRRAHDGYGETDPGTWVMVAAGMMRPGLKKLGEKLVSRWPGDRVDLDAELLEGFLQRLEHIEPVEAKIYYRLRDAAERRGQEACNRENRIARSRVEPGRSTPLRPRDGHPDLALATALIAGAVSKREADLLYELYLVGTPPREVAEKLGLAIEDLDNELGRAVNRLVDHLDQAEDEMGAGG